MKRYAYQWVIVHKVLHPRLPVRPRDALDRLGNYYAKLNIGSQYEMDSQMCAELSRHCLISGRLKSSNYPVINHSEVFTKYLKSFEQSLHSIKYNITAVNVLNLYDRSKYQACFGNPRREA